MSRDFVINGESLVRVRFGAQLSPSISNIVGSQTNLSELGLTEGDIRVSPNWSHDEIHADDYGPNIPAELHWMLSDCNITMRLAHFDPVTLQRCIQQSMAGQSLTNDGIMAGAGTPMGGFVPFLASGYYFMSMNILSPVLSTPWRFPAAYLAERPFSYPLSTKRSLVDLNWRAIPLPPNPTVEITSSGSILWDHQTQT